MKELRIKKLKPTFTTVLTTLDTFEEDWIVDGMVAAPKGALKLYQRVVAVGPMVRDVKVGDLVLLNLSAYLQRKFKPGSIKEDMTEMEEEKVFDFPKMVMNETLYGKFQERDIDGIIEEYEEVEAEKPQGLI